LADAYALLGSVADAEIPRKEAMPRARAAALKGLEIDETLSEAHTSLAFVRMHYDWDWPGAEKEFERAIQLNSGYSTAHQWHAYNLMVQGRTEESLTEIHQALELDPLSLIINTDAIELTYYARRYDDAIRLGRKTIEMDSRFPLAHAFTALCYLQKKEYAKAIVELQGAVLESGDRIDKRANLAAAYALAGRPDEARKALKGLKNDLPQRSDAAFHVARVYVALGEAAPAPLFFSRSIQPTIQCAPIRVSKTCDAVSASIGSHRRSGTPSQFLHRQLTTFLVCVLLVAWDRQESGSFTS
jgi:adenylate cyclase